MVGPEVWSAVEGYVESTLLGSDPVGARVLAGCAAAGLPEIAVSPAQGALLHLLARARGARRVLEVGTLGGYSALWWARAVGPAGRVVSLERDPDYARVARANLAEAGVGAVVEVRVGAAVETLPGLVGEEPFDVVFIDADKPNNVAYFSWAMRLTAPGAVIVVDNVVRGGAVVEADSGDESVRGTRAVLAAVAAELRVSASVVQTVGAKGYDGMLVAVRVG